MVEDSNFDNSSFAILAGGRASRMRESGETGKSVSSASDNSVLDKCLLSVGGETILERIVTRLGASNFSSSALNANGELVRFAELAREHGLDLVSDLAPSREKTSSSSAEQFSTSLSGHLLGPLLGLLSSMRWARARGSRWLLTVPGDCPFLPSDLFSRLRLRQSSSRALITCAASRDSNGAIRRHPVTALWHVSLHDDLADSLFSQGIRKIDLWTSRHSLAFEEWDSPLDLFFNVNSPDDLARANSLALTDFQ